MTKAGLIEVIYKALPYSEQVTNLDLDSEPKAIRFEWRGDEFRVELGLSVEQIEPSVLVGSNLAMVLEALLKRTWTMIRERAVIVKGEAA